MPRKTTQARPMSRKMKRSAVSRRSFKSLPWLRPAGVVTTPMIPTTKNVTTGCCRAKAMYVTGTTFSHFVSKHYSAISCDRGSRRDHEWLRRNLFRKFFPLSETHPLIPLFEDPRFVVFVFVFDCHLLYSDSRLEEGELQYEVTCTK